MMTEVKPIVWRQFFKECVYFSHLTLHIEEVKHYNFSLVSGLRKMEDVFLVKKIGQFYDFFCFFVYIFLLVVTLDQLYF